MKDECKHRHRVRVGKWETLCVQCLERKSGNGKLPGAPRGWRHMDQGELAIWYARYVLKADLSGHGRKS